MRNLFFVLAVLCLADASLAATVTPNVTQQGGLFTYEYTVDNNEGILDVIEFRLVVLTLPDELFAPPDWMYGLEPRESGELVLYWIALGTGISVGGTQNGFIVQSRNTPGPASFEVVDALLGVTNREAIIGPAGEIAAPEPGSLGLAAGAMAALLALKRLRA